jgi:hypothetical protein
MNHTQSIHHSSNVLFSVLAALGFCPAFAAEIRPLSTDRPDATESPQTVDAGRYQLEMELGSWTRDGGDWTEFSLGELNAKLGLDDSTDLQWVLPFYSHVRNGAEGFGDVQIRLKRNLWGNDGGPHALALMPFVKLPTADSGLGNGDFEGGLIVPFGFDGPAGWSFGVMGELDLVSDDDGGGYLVEALVSAVASHGITENTAAFMEIVGIFTPESSDEQEGYFNTGMTLALSETQQLDGGVRVGLTAASTDFSPFFGFSVKF